MGTTYSGSSGQINGQRAVRRACADDQQFLVVRRPTLSARALSAARMKARSGSRLILIVWSAWLGLPQLRSLRPHSFNGVIVWPASARPSDVTSTAKTYSLPKFDSVLGQADELAFPCSYPRAPRTSSSRRGSNDAAILAHLGNPAETTYLLSRLIFDWTFDKFPNLASSAPRRRLPGRRTSDARTRPQVRATRNVNKNKLGILSRRKS